MTTPRTTWKALLCGVALLAAMDLGGFRSGRGPRGWPRSQQSLRTIRDLCHKANVPFLLLDHTMPAIEPLPAFCAAEGIDYAPLRFTPEERKLGLTNSRLDAHCNARGHDLLLQKLRAILAERHLLPAPR